MKFRRKASIVGVAGDEFSLWHFYAEFSSALIDKISRIKA